MIYSGGAILGRLVSAASPFLIIKVIDPTEFGKLSLINNLIGILSILFGLGLRQTLAIEFFLTSQPWHLIWHLFLIYMIGIVPCLALIMIGLKQLGIFNLGMISPTILSLVFVVGITNFIPELGLQLWRFQYQARRASLMQIGLSGLNGLLVLLLIKASSLNIVKLLLAQLASQLIIGLIFVHQLCQSYEQFSWPTGREVCKYLKVGLPFIPNLFFAWLIIASNRWLLHYHGVELATIGRYSLAENLALIFQTIITLPLIHSFIPHAMQKMATDKQLWVIDRQNLYLATYFIGGGSLLICALASLIPSFASLLPAGYRAATPLICPLLLAQLIFAASQITGATIQYLKQTHYLALGMATGAMVGAIINWYLIPAYGANSCLIASNVAYLTYFGAILALKTWIFAKFQPF